MQKLRCGITFICTKVGCKCGSVLPSSLSKYKTGKVANIKRCIYLNAKVLQHRFLTSLLQGLCLSQSPLNIICSSNNNAWYVCARGFLNAFRHCDHDTNSLNCIAEFTAAFCQHEFS